MNGKANRLGRNIMAAGVLHEAKDGTLDTSGLREMVVEELKRPAILERATALIRSPEFQRTIDEITRDHAKALVVEVLAERDGELESAVRRIVAERWDEAVSRAAHDILDRHIDAIRRRLA